MTRQIQGVVCLFALFLMVVSWPAAFAQTNSTTGVKLTPTKGTTIELVPRRTGSLLPQEKVTLTLESIDEFDLADNSSKFEIPSFENGSWTEVPDSRYNATTSYLYSAELGWPDGGGGVVVQGTVQMQFYVFDKDTPVTVGEGVSPFVVSPSLAKFSINITGWPWSAKGDEVYQHGIRVMMGLDPVYNASERYDNTPQAGMTTFKLLGQYTTNTNAYTQLRLLEAVELDGTVYPTGRVEYAMQEDRPLLIMRFRHFNSTLLYDPDFGVLLGSTDGGGGDGSTSDNTALIVCLAVILPVAAVVVLVVGAVVLLGYFRHQRTRIPAPSGAVDIGHDI